MDNATARNNLTEMDPDFAREDETKDSRTKYPEVVDPFDCFIPSIDIFFRVSWHATE